MKASQGAERGDGLGGKRRNRDLDQSYVPGRRGDPTRGVTGRRCLEASLRRHSGRDRLAPGRRERGRSGSRRHRCEPGQRSGFGPGARRDDGLPAARLRLGLDSDGPRGGHRWHCGRRFLSRRAHCGFRGWCGGGRCGFPAWARRSLGGARLSEGRNARGDWFGRGTGRHGRCRGCRQVSLPRCIRGPCLGRGTRRKLRFSPLDGHRDKPRFCGFEAALRRRRDGRCAGETLPNTGRVGEPNLRTVPAAGCLDSHKGRPTLGAHSNLLKVVGGRRQLPDAYREPVPGRFRLVERQIPGHMQGVRVTRRQPEMTRLVLQRQYRVLLDHRWRRHDARSAREPVACITPART